MNWKEINTKACIFANAYYSRIANKPEYYTDERKACSAAYQSSISEKANPFNGLLSLNERKELREEGEVFLEDFLKKQKFDNDSCYKAMARIRQIYRNGNVPNYTYGNAQKWVNMSIKYYYIVKSITNVNRIDVNSAFVYFPGLQDYKLFPVDTKILNLIYPKYGWYLPSEYPAWYLCDDLEVFKHIWDDMRYYFENTFGEMWAWELLSWNPSKKALNKPQIFTIQN